MIWKQVFGQPYFRFVMTYMRQEIEPEHVHFTEQEVSEQREWTGAEAKLNLQWKIFSLTERHSHTTKLLFANLV